MGTSSADPHKLDEYATEGVELVSALRTKVNEVTDALDALSASSSEHLPQYPGLADMLTDLVDDWAHQDEFVGDVAHGFFAANGGADATEVGTVLEFDNETLLTMGEIGYADRDVAIAMAEELSEELERLQDQEGGASALQMDLLVGMAARGQYDPAFAVTFSEQVGVDGYVEATAMFEAAYTADGRDLTDAIPQVGILSTILTTALDTLPRDENDEYRDPSNADLPEGTRLSEDFVHDLITGYQPDDTGGDGPVDAPENGRPLTGHDDLSLLISMSEPPTSVAIDIAENRMEPFIHPGASEEAGGRSWWPEGVRDPLTNYATMLARNPDASAGWLIGEGNIELALETPFSSTNQGGAALADVVEAGLTNPDMQVRDDGGLIREELMNRAITFVGEEGEDFDMPNESMYDALASGVEENMSVIDERINSPWSVQGEGYAYDGDNDSMTQTQTFLAEVMSDEDARDRVRDAATSYVHDQLDHLPADVAGAGADDRDHRLNELGRISGIVGDADIDVISEDFDEHKDAADLTGRVADYIVSLTRGGQYNDILALAEQNVGAWIADGLGPDDEEFRQNVQNLVLTAQNEIDGLDLLSDDRAQLQSAASSAAAHSG